MTLSKYLQSVHSAGDTLCRRDCPAAAIRRRRNWIGKLKHNGRIRKGYSLLRQSAPKSMRQVIAGFGATIAFADGKMLGGFSVISSYAEMKLEVSPSLDACPLEIDVCKPCAVLGSWARSVA